MALGFAATSAALRGGDRLMVTHPNPLKPDERITYGLVTAGQRVSIHAYRSLVRGQHLAPCGDGLLGDSQTFEWQETPNAATA